MYGIKDFIYANNQFIKNTLQIVREHEAPDMEHKRYVVGLIKSAINHLDTALKDITLLDTRSDFDYLFTKYFRTFLEQSLRRGMTITVKKYEGVLLDALSEAKIEADKKEEVVVPSITMDDLWKLLTSIDLDYIPCKILSHDYIKQVFTKAEIADLALDILIENRGGIEDGLLEQLLPYIEEVYPDLDMDILTRSEMLGITQQACLAPEYDESEYEPEYDELEVRASSAPAILQNINSSQKLEHAADGAEDEGADRRVHQLPTMGFREERAEDDSGIPASVTVIGGEEGSPLDCIEF